MRGSVSSKYMIPTTNLYFCLTQSVISKSSDLNMMTSHNLAICVAPCLLRSHDVSLLTHKVVQLLIDNYDVIFQQPKKEGILQCLIISPSSKIFVKISFFYSL